MITTSNAAMSLFLCIPRIIGHALLGLALLLLGGCSTLRLAYNQSDTVVYWWVDRHVDLSAEQKTLVRSALADLQTWHRQTQLPEYIALLQRVRAMAPRDITSDEVCSITQEAQASYRRLLHQIEPAATQLLAHLKPEQLRNIQRRYDLGNDEWREEWLDGSAEKRLRHRMQQATKRLEDFYGRLEPGQRERLQQWLEGTGYDPSVSYAERLRRQQDSLQTFERMRQVGGANASTQALLQGWVDRGFTSPVARHREHAQSVWQMNCKGFAQWHNQTTPEQRQRLASTLLGYENDLRAVMR